MDDSRLLELAGRAAGEVYSLERNPLERDDLALRLAVKRHLHIVFTENSVQVWESEDSMTALAVEELGPDPYAATRRAIVSAAAAIGEQA